MRLSQAKATDQDYFWPNGLKDAEVIFGEVARAGVEFIHLASEKSGFAYHSSTKAGENLAEYARKLTGLPVIANGGLQDPVLANDIVASGKADFISVGKSALVNPDLPERIAAGSPPREFTFDVFKYGVSIQGQQRWENERSVDA